MTTDEQQTLKAFSESKIGLEEVCSRLGLPNADWHPVLERLAQEGLPYPHPAAADSRYLGNIERVKRVISSHHRS
jgi:DNA-binding IclR family transcriptional regulator